MKTDFRPRAWRQRRLGGPWSWLVAGMVGSACLLQAQVPQPIVAVHDSEYTRALESMAATGSTPTGPGTTNKQWWITDWHYFVIPESLKEAFRSDGTAFQVVGDSNILAGALLTNGQPAYPILISCASEAIRDNEIAALTNYVAAGGFLLVGSSSFTRATNGSSRADFAFANELGLHMSVAGLANWADNNYFNKQTNHRLVRDIPFGQLTWRMPSSSEEIPWGISPSHPFLAPHDIWKVQASDATVLVTGDSYPVLAVKAYGKGYFIYHAAFNPLIGHSGFAPGMYAYLIVRRAVEWAFETLRMPVLKLSPWPYDYDAALMVRHDLENFTNEVAAIEASAQMEYTNGAHGDYYFCTGTLRDDAYPAYNTNALVASLRRAVTNYGASIGPHNGGLKNPNNPALVRGNYDYWHWGPDEALDVTPAGYSSGKSYASTSVSNSFRDVEGWLNGLTNGIRSWVGCYFNSTRENSYDVLSQLNVRIAGEQKLTPFPHWTLSTQTPGKRYPMLSQPVSDWFVGGLVAQSLEPWHPPGVHTTQTLHDAIDFYYNLGALVNLYSHTLSTGLGGAGQLAPEYVYYSLNTNLHPRLWSANAFGVYQWWLQRSNAQVTVSCATNGGTTIASFSISGSASTNTGVELLIPGTNSPCSIQVATNGTVASGGAWRVNGQLVKVRVGTAVTNVSVSLCWLMPSLNSFSENFDAVSPPALPAGWTTSSSGAQSPWVTLSGTNDTAPNTVFSSDATNIGVNELISPPFALPVGTSQLTFRHFYDLEAGSAAYDGGVLEIKIGSGGFTDVLAAGGLFLAGGYTGTIDSSYGNPLAGRQAWSGNSRGFVTTILNLPAAASGQTVQLRWRCGTDNGNGASGWRVDSVSVASLVCGCGANSGPILGFQPDRTIAELSSLAVTNTASDSDSGSQTLMYRLIGAPAGAVIDTNGVITWTPSEAQGPGVYTLTTVVTDNGLPPLSATNSFTVTVLEVNTAPVLPTQTDLTVAELTLLTVTNTAADPDLPPNNLTYQLIDAPAGAAIDTNGVITWTPSEAQGPGVYLLETVVTDDGVPPLSATNSFRVTVLQVNSAPVLPAQTNVTMAELTLLTVTNTAADPGLPPNDLSYQLINAPADAVIDTNGVIAWTPSEAQGPGVYTLTTVVTDNGVPPLSATNSFTVTVLEVNSAPVLPTQTNLTVAELTLLTVTNTAADSDLPPNALGYRLINAPAGAAIDTNGVLTWTPSEAQGPGVYTLTTVVTDNGVPPLSATNSFTVTVLEVNSAPVLPAQPDRTIVPLTTLIVANTASDSDIPTNSLTYTLLVGPTNASLSSDGILMWTPTEQQNHTTNLFRTVVTDDNPWALTSQHLSATNSFTVFVNTKPVLSVASATLAAEGCLPTNGVVDPGETVTMLFAITNSGTGNTTNLVVTLLEANGVTSPSAQQTYGLVPAGGAPVTQPFTFTAVGSCGGSISAILQLQDGPASLGTLTNTFSLGPNNPPLSQSFDAVAAPALPSDWTTAASGAQLPWITVASNSASAPNTLFAREAAGVGVSEVVSPTFVPGAQAQLAFQNNYNLEASATTSTNAYDGGVLEIQIGTNAFVDILAAGGSFVTNGYNAVIDTRYQNPLAGRAAWSGNSGGYVQTVVNLPAAAAGQAVRLKWRCGTDTSNTRTGWWIDNISVTGWDCCVNAAPVLAAQTNRTVSELATLTVSNTVASAGAPVGPILYSLQSPPAGAQIDSDGVITWTPNEAQGPGVYTLTTVAANSTYASLAATNSFTVMVLEVNSAPVLPEQTNVTLVGMGTLFVTNTASDPDVPANPISYQLLVGPTGAAISPEGVISWTPGAEYFPSTNYFETMATDTNPAAIANQSLSATNGFWVFVHPIHTAPSLPLQADRTINEVVDTLVVTNFAGAGAGASNSPPLQLSYALEDPPAGATIDTNGVIRWTPSEAQGPGTNTLKTIVTDNGSPPLSATNAFTVVVNEVNTPPTLSALANQTVSAGDTLRVTNVVFDPDLPPNPINFTLLASPAGATIDTNGVISWISSTNDIGLTLAFQVEAADYNAWAVKDNTLAATNSFLVFVAPPSGWSLRISSISVTNGLALLKWDASIGRTYRLEFKASLLQATWTELAPDILAVEATAAFTNQATESQGFYRLRLLP